ncbi:hypothetical protein [Nonomuraea guangzhouensis]|uniref:Uncharacterized protein n=1 Tax=Nonomuraea guangzhouensis TaxID=1291555 RepID=A0ABW4GZE8_9ACTN|nr:hypothetical protein [Nonomuraea guangzhouensis]
MQHYPDVANHDPGLERAVTLVKEALGANEHVHRRRPLRRNWWRVRLFARFMLFWAVERKLLRRNTRIKLIQRELCKALAPVEVLRFVRPTNRKAAWTMAYACRCGCGYPALAYSSRPDALFFGTCADGHSTTLHPLDTWRGDLA